MNKTIHPIEPEELMAYLDGELSADRAADAVEHLGQCGECQALVADLRGVSQTLRAWEVHGTERGIPRTVVVAIEDSKPELGKVAAEERRNGRSVLSQRWGTVAWAGGVAAIAVVVYVGTVTLKGGNANMAFSTVSEELSVQRREASVPNPAPPGKSLSAPAATGGATASTSAGMHTYTYLQQSPTVDRQPVPDQTGRVSSHEPANRGSNIPTVNGPMIIRTADLALITKEFDKARAAIESTLKRHHGYVGQLKVGGATGSGRTLTATLRVPADQLDATLAELKGLGRVESETQGGEDVTSQYVDLQARLANSRNTEQRLTDLLRQRTGKLSDVLEVEQEVDRVRGEIEQMEAEKKNMANQVSFATVNATISEDYKAELHVVPPSTSTRLSNAAVEGYRSVVDGVLNLALFLLSTGPSLLIWAVILFFPARYAWKKVRRGFAQ